MKEAVTKVIDTLTQEDFHGAFEKLLERYKCIAAGGDYFEGDNSLASLSDFLVSYPGFLLGGAYFSAEILSVYSTALDDWNTGHSLGGVLPLFRDAVGVFYSAS